MEPINNILIHRALTSVRTQYELAAVKKYISVAVSLDMQSNKGEREKG
jgi:hypothetical protein